MDYKSVFTNLCLELQQNRSWIKGLGKKSTKRVNSFTDDSAFCPGAPKRVPSDFEKLRRVYTSSNVCHSHEWRVDTASGKTLKKTKCVFTRCPTGGQKKFACIYGLRSKGVNKCKYQPRTSGCWRSVRNKGVNKYCKYYCLCPRVYNYYITISWVPLEISSSRNQQTVPGLNLCWRKTKHSDVKQSTDDYFFYNDFIKVQRQDFPLKV